MAGYFAALRTGPLLVRFALEGWLATRHRGNTNPPRGKHRRPVTDEKWARWVALSGLERAPDPLRHSNQGSQHGEEKDQAETPALLMTRRAVPSDARLFSDYGVRE